MESLPRHHFYQLSILIHVFIAFLFLSIFFVIVVSNSTEKVVTKEIKHLTTGMIGELLNSLSVNSKIKEEYSEEYWKLKRKVFENDERKKDNNEWVYIVIGLIATFILLLALSSFFWLKLACNLEIPTGALIVQNIAIATLVITFEIIFFFVVTNNYVPTDIIGLSLRTKKVVKDELTYYLNV